MGRMNYIAKALIGLGVAIYAYRTIKAAIDEPPEETRQYDSYTAEILDSEDSWFDCPEPEDCNG